MRFGFSLTALDVNRDGTDDLVVSAPAYSGEPDNTTDDFNVYYPKEYLGRVYIYFGKKEIGIA